jgi:hypothetical protein
VYHTHKINLFIINEETVEISTVLIFDYIIFNAILMQLNYFNMIFIFAVLFSTSSSLYLLKIVV